MEKNKRLTGLATLRTKPSSSLEKEILNLKKAVAQLEAENQELRESVARLETQLSSRGAGVLHIHNHPRKQAWWENLPPGTII